MVFPRPFSRLALIMSCGVLAACHDQYSRDPKVAAGYAAAAGALAVAEAVASAHSSSASSRHEGADADLGNDLQALRKYSVDALNRFREEHDSPALASSDPLHEFAQRGSEWLRDDHKPNAHVHGDARCSTRCGELQGDPNGEPGAASPKDQIDRAIERMKTDATQSAILLAPERRFVGIGIVNPGGAMYLTIDLSNVDFE